MLYLFFPQMSNVGYVPENSALIKDRSEQNSKEQGSVILCLELPLWVRRVVSNVIDSHSGLFMSVQKKKKVAKKADTHLGGIIVLARSKTNTSTSNLFFLNVCNKVIHHILVLWEQPAVPTLHEAGTFHNYSRSTILLKHPILGVFSGSHRFSNCSQQDAFLLLAIPLRNLINILWQSTA